MSRRCPYQYKPKGTRFVIIRSYGNNGFKASTLVQGKSLIHIVVIVDDDDDDDDDEEVETCSSLNIETAEEMFCKEV